MARTKQTARKSSGGIRPKRQLSKTKRKRSYHDSDNEPPCKKQKKDDGESDISDDEGNDLTQCYECKDGKLEFSEGRCDGRNGIVYCKKCWDQKEEDADNKRETVFVVTTKVVKGFMVMDMKPEFREPEDLEYTNYGMKYRSLRAANEAVRGVLNAEIEEYLGCSDRIYVTINGEDGVWDEESEQWVESGDIGYDEDLDKYPIYKPPYKVYKCSLFFEDGSWSEYWKDYERDADVEGSVSIEVYLEERKTTRMYQVRMLKEVEYKRENRYGIEVEKKEILDYYVGEFVYVKLKNADKAAKKLWNKERLELRYDENDDEELVDVSPFHQEMQFHTDEHDGCTMTVWVQRMNVINYDQ